MASVRSDLRAPNFKKIFLGGGGGGGGGGACPQTPLACVCLRMYHHWHPQVHYFVDESPYNDTELPSLLFTAHRHCCEKCVTLLASFLLSCCHF